VGDFAITVRALAEGSGVLVRATILAPFSQSCVVRIPAVTGAAMLEIPCCDLFQPEPTDAAVEAIRLLLQQVDSLRQTALRAQAEIYELGGHGLRPSFKVPG
jgi:hypothetical protein